MAVINFPDPSQSPWLNESTGITYTYFNGVWKVTGSTESEDSGSGSSSSSSSPSTIISATQPAVEDLEEGSLWWNSTLGRLFILYITPSTSVKSWVEASPDTDTDTDTIIDLSSLDLLPPAGE